MILWLFLGKIRHFVSDEHYQNFPKNSESEVKFMSESKTVLLAQLASEEDSVKCLEHIERRLQKLNIPVRVFYKDDLNPDCGIRIGNEERGYKVVGCGSRLSYDDIARLEHIVEQYYVEAELANLRPRMAKIGWKVYSRDDGLIHIETVESGSDDRGYDPTYENIWQIEMDLRRAEMRRLVLRFHLEVEGKISGELTERLRPEGDGIVYVAATRRPKTIPYSNSRGLEQVAEALRLEFSRDEF